MNVMFVRPQFLLLLFAIPLLILVHFMSLKFRKKDAVVFANFEAISRIRGIDFYSKNISILVLSILVVFFITLASAGMTIKQELYSSSFSFVIAIDSSQSMQADDLLPSRFEAAKSLSAVFINSAAVGTRMGIVSFSGEATIEHAVTSDKSALNGRLSSIQISGVGGTDVTGAIMAGMRLLSKEENRAIIVLSDGQFNVGNINSSVYDAVDQNVIVHTIAIGTTEGGQTSYGMSKLEKDALRAIAFETGGKFFEATNSKELEKGFESIAAMKIKDVEFSLSSYLYIIAMIIFVVEFVLINTRYKTIP